MIFSSLISFLGTAIRVLLKQNVKKVPFMLRLVTIMENFYLES